MYDLNNFLSISRVFGELSTESIKALSSVMKVANFQHHHIFTRQGSTADALHLILDGCVELRAMDDLTDEELEPKVLHAGDIFGQLALGDNMPMEATAIGISKTLTASLNVEEFKKLKLQYPAINFSFLFILASQMARELQEINANSRKRLN
jgi:CRP-like cAMP-binding protein